MNWLSNIFSGPKDTESVLEAIFSPPVPERLEGDRQGMLAADNPVRQLSDDKLGRTHRELAAQSGTHFLYESRWPLRLTIS